MSIHVMTHLHTPAKRRCCAAATIAPAVEDEIDLLTDDESSDCTIQYRLVSEEWDSLSCENFDDIEEADFWAVCHKSQMPYECARPQY